MKLKVGNGIAIYNAIPLLANDLLKVVYSVCTLVNCVVQFFIESTMTCGAILSIVIVSDCVKHGRISSVLARYFFLSL